MKKILLAAAAVISLGVAGTASAATADAEIGFKPSTESSIAEAGYYWQRGSFWRGNCFYRYVYVSDGYRYRYRYVYNCY